jgi:DNA polymerase III alpha subunit (gram-positive type)
MQVAGRSAKIAMNDEKTTTFQKDLCFIDVETTGPIIGFHEIIDIALIRTCPNAEARVSACNFKVAPRYPERMTEFARQLTGFTVEEWVNTPLLKAVWQDLRAVSRGATPVCHNPSFDRAFIALAALHIEEEDLGLDYHWIGTESLAWPLAKCLPTWPRKTFSQASICATLGLEEEHVVHSAERGAESCLRLYRRLIELYSAANLRLDA